MSDDYPGPRGFGGRYGAKEQEPDRDAETLWQVGEALGQAWPKDGLLSIPQTGPSDALIEALYDAGLRTGAPPALPATPAETGLREALTDIIALLDGGSWGEDATGRHYRTEAIRRARTALESPREDR